MYRIIPENEQREYTFEQKQNEFNGKWIYLVNAEFTESNGLIKAIPVVIADSELEGVEEGIYDQYQDESYGESADADFTNMCVAIPSVLWGERI